MESRWVKLLALTAGLTAYRVEACFTGSKESNQLQRVAVHAASTSHRFEGLMSNATAMRLYTTSAPELGPCCHDIQTSCAGITKLPSDSLACCLLLEVGSLTSRQRAADKHARENGEQRRKAIRQESNARLAASDSSEAEELSEAQQTYDNIVLALVEKVDKAMQAYEAVHTEMVQKWTQQVCSSQEELVNRLMSVLESAKRTHKV